MMAVLEVAAEVTRRALADTASVVVVDPVNVRQVEDGLGRFTAFALTVTSSAFGAGFGAWIAFKLTRDREVRATRDKNFSEGKRAQFVIATQMSALKTLQDTLLKPHRASASRHLDLPPMVVANRFVEVQIEPLLFMLDGDGADLLQRLWLEQQRFEATLGAVATRNGILRDYRAGQQMAVSFPGAPTEENMRFITDQVYDMIDKTAAQHQSVLDDLGRFLQSYCPGRPILRFEELPPSDPPKEQTS